MEGARTKPEAVLALLDTKPGAEFNPVTWERDLRRLRNLDYFYDIDGASRLSEGKVDLSLRLRNKFSTCRVRHARFNSYRSRCKICGDWTKHSNEGQCLRCRLTPTKK